MPHVCRGFGLIANCKKVTSGNRNEWDLIIHRHVGPTKPSYGCSCRTPPVLILEILPFLDEPPTDMTKPLFKCHQCQNPNRQLTSFDVVAQTICQSNQVDIPNQGSNETNEYYSFPFHCWLVKNSSWFTNGWLMEIRSWQWADFCQVFLLVRGAERQVLNRSGLSAGGCQRIGGSPFVKVDPGWVPHTCFEWGSLQIGCPGGSPFVIFEWSISW